MGEDLEIIDVDVRQRKSSKNKNQNDDIVTSGGGGGDGGRGSSKRRRRGRGDRTELIKLIPEEETLSDGKEKKGKIVINKKPESDDDAGDDGDDAYDSSLEDEESSGSWLFKLIIIAIIVSLGFSLIWLNDGSSSTDLDGIDSDGPFNDIGDSYIPENIENDEGTVRGDIEETNDQGYQEYQQWSHEYDDSSSDRAEIIAEVSENIGEINEVNDEPEYQTHEESRDQGYFVNEQTVADQEPVEPKTWTNEQDYQTENQPEEQFTSFQEPELVNPNQQSDHDYPQQTWQYQEQVEQQQVQHVEEAIIEQQVPQQAQLNEQYESHSDEQLAQSSVENNPDIDETRENEPVEERYECPEGSYWDGLSCVNPESFIQMDDFSNVDEKKPETIEENIFYPEHQ